MPTTNGKDGVPITTRFLELSVSFTASQKPLREHIEATLKVHGEPLRWAITAVDSNHHILRVEAVVTQDTVSS